MTGIFHFLIGELPVWARREHPALRMEQAQRGRPSLGGRFVRAAVSLAAVAGLLVIGVIVGTDFWRRPLTGTLSDQAFAILSVPLVILNLVMGISALATTVGFVSELRARALWDMVRVTANGIDLALRARWSVTFVRFQGLLVLAIGGRLLLIALLLWDMVAFQGGFLPLLSSGVTPAVAAPVAVVILALAMTAAVLLPLTGMGLDAAFGLWASTFVRGRLSMMLIRGVSVLGREAVFGLLLFGADRIRAGQWQEVSDLLTWGVVTSAALLAEYGVGFLNLTHASALWTALPFGVFVGAAALAGALLQALLADQFLKWAAQRGQRVA